MFKGYVKVWGRGEMGEFGRHQEAGGEDRKSGGRGAALSSEGTHPPHRELGSRGMLGQLFFQSCPFCVSYFINQCMFMFAMFFIMSIRSKIERKMSYVWKYLKECVMGPEGQPDVYRMIKKIDNG